MGIGVREALSQLFIGLNTVNINLKIPRLHVEEDNFPDILFRFDPLTILPPFVWTFFGVFKLSRVAVLLLVVRLRAIYRSGQQFQRHGGSLPVAG